MSITFTALDRNGRPLTTGAQQPNTACLCAQMAESWDMYLETADLAELVACADPNCRWCRGTGVAPGETEVLELDLANCTAGALLGLLGLMGAVGSASLFDARRAIMRARATFERRAPRFTYGVANEGVFGAPTAEARPTVVREGNVARIVRGARVIAGDLASLDEAGLGERLERFAALVERAAALGASEIQWA